MWHKICKRSGVLKSGENPNPNEQSVILTKS